MEEDENKNYQILEFCYFFTRVCIFNDKFWMIQDNLKWIRIIQ